jgi:hypothetical protein
MSEIAKHFPGRSRGSFQVRYSTRLRDIRDRPVGERAAVDEVCYWGGNFFRDMYDNVTDSSPSLKMLWRLLACILSDE